MNKIYHVLEHLNTNSYYKTKVHYRFFILGCGGNGGYVAQHVTQMVSMMDKKSRIFLIDPDIVENHNLKNQLFIKSDVNKSKAEVLAKRYRAAYGISVSYFDKNYVETIEQLDKIVFSSNYIEGPGLYHTLYLNVIIGCVDNNYTRGLLHKYFNKVDNLIYIDSGVQGSKVPKGKTLNNRNEWTTSELETYKSSGYVGQVCIGVKSKGKVILPPVAEVFPNLLDNAENELKPSESCSALLQSEPQRLITNRYAALIIAGYINELLSTNTIRNHKSVFNSRENYIQTSPIPSEEDIELMKEIREMKELV